MAHQTNTAIVLNHHMSRSGHSRGSTAIKAAADQEWAFQRTTTADGSLEETVGGTIRVEGRFGPPLSMPVELSETLRWQVVDAQPLPHEGASARGRVLTLLRTTGEWLGAQGIADRLEEPVKTIQNTISVLLAEESPLIVHRGSGRRNDPRQYHAPNPVVLTLEQCGLVPGSR
jgi:hypothetical protein